MPLSDLTDPAAVNAAMDEFDRIGRDNFLRKYRFWPFAGLFCPSRWEAVTIRKLSSALLTDTNIRKRVSCARRTSAGEKTLFAPSSRRLGFPSRCVDQTSLRRLPAMI